MRTLVLPAFAALFLSAATANATDKPGTAVSVTSLPAATATAAAPSAPEATIPTITTSAKTTAPVAAIVKGADGTLEQKIILKDHVFTPSAFTLPADEKVKLTIDNQDSTAEEFDSHDLKREKVVAANSIGSFVVGPLKAGTYKFEGEFHSGSAKGTITVK